MAFAQYMKVVPAKYNWTVEESEWKLYDKGELKNWDSLKHYFLELTDKNADYKENSFLREWKKALLRAKSTVANE